MTFSKLSYDVFNFSFRRFIMTFYRDVLNNSFIKQYKLSLNIPANLDGLKTAEEEAHELGKLMARQQFVWNDKYLGQTANQVEDIVKTVGEILAEFEIEYFKTHKVTEKI